MIMDTKIVNLQYSKKEIDFNITIKMSPTDLQISNPVFAVIEF